MCHNVKLLLQVMDREFRRWIKWYGKTHTAYQVDKGDFLEDHMKDRINGAT